MFDSARTVITLPSWLESVFQRTGLNADDIGKYHLVRDVLSENDLVHIINSATLFQFGFIYNRTSYVAPYKVFRVTGHAAAEQGAERLQTLPVLATWLAEESASLLRMLPEFALDIVTMANRTKAEPCYLLDNPSQVITTHSSLKEGFANGGIRSYNGLVATNPQIVGHIYYQWWMGASEEHRRELEGYLELSCMDGSMLKSIEKLIIPTGSTCLYTNAFNNPANHGVLFVGFGKKHDETTPSYLNRLLCSDFVLTKETDFEVFNIHREFAITYLTMLDLRAGFRQVASTLLYDGLCRLLID